jgi:hypothetical protein
LSVVRARGLRQQETVVESVASLVLACFLVGLCQASLPSGWLRSMTRGAPRDVAIVGLSGLQVCPT